jgi:translation initiation factor IF-1
VAKEDSIQVNGKVTDVLPNAMFKVELESRNIVIAYLGGKLRKNDIRVLLGDRVTLEMSPYDLTRARIVYRNK